MSSDCTATPVKAPSGKMRAGRIVDSILSHSFRGRLLSSLKDQYWYYYNELYIEKEERYNSELKIDIRCVHCNTFANAYHTENL